jgi:hypothetical protein
MDHVFDIFNQFATDPNKELDGVWVPLGAALRKLPDGVTPDPESVPQIKVARSGNKRHGRIVSQLWEANETVLKGKDDAADSKGEEVTIEAMAKGVLLGWKNLTFKGEKLVDGWDIETAKRLLAVKDFRELVAKHANDREKYLLAAEKADAGN